MNKKRMKGTKIRAINFKKEKRKNKEIQICELMISKTNQFSRL